MYVNPPEDLLKILLIFVESCLVCIQNVQIMHANIDILNSLVVYTTFDTYVPVQLKSSQQSVSLKEKQGEVFETGQYFIY